MRRVSLSYVKSFCTCFVMSREEYDRIVGEVAEELGVDMSNVLMPDYKLKSLYRSMGEDDFREYMKGVLQTLVD